jgi:DNA-binding transcriptional ArsR family regulator
MRGTAGLSKIFKALSVDARVRIVLLLKGRTLCVNALAARLRITAAAVSQHLRVLRDAGIVTSEKRGYWVHYRVNPAALRRWKARTDGLLEAGEESRGGTVAVRRKRKARPGTRPKVKSPAKPKRKPKVKPRLEPRPRSKGRPGARAKGKGD